MLVARLLESTADNATRLDACQFLQESREVTFKWLWELAAKLQDADVESQVIDFQRRVCEMAAICRSTYDVNPAYFPYLLSTSNDYSILISCFVTLYANQPPDLRMAPPGLRGLLYQDRRLAYKITPVLVQKLKENPRLLDQAVSQHWDDYHPGPCGWAILSDLNPRWVSTTTSSGAQLNAQQVHLDLQQGNLLVDGQPLGRLPQEYVAHPIYAQLFGQVGLRFHFCRIVSDALGLFYNRKYSVLSLPTLREWFIQYALILKETRCVGCCGQQSFMFTGF
jgi:hypothetical protein